MLLNPILAELAADWCINASAGLFGATFFVPATSKQPRAVNQAIMVLNIAYAVAFFLVAHILKAGL